MGRLAHAELALHALLPLRQGPTGHGEPGDVAAPRLDALAAALGTTMRRPVASTRVMCENEQQA